MGPRRLAVALVTKRLRLLGRLLCGCVVAFLLLPVGFGWQHTALSRQLVLEWARQGTTVGRMETKFLYGHDLPSGLFLGDHEPLPGKGYWVVASSSGDLVPYGCALPCSPPPGWSMGYVADDAPLMPPVLGVAAGTKAEPRWPAVFDRMPDRSGPSWWPLVPPLVVAVPAAALSLLLGIVILTRARREGRPT